jgi:16S rRNA (cytosine967-C5)-methyltransferase
VGLSAEAHAARHAAIQLLDAVLDQRRTLNAAFDEGTAGKGNAAALQGLATRDRAFARLLAATTLRRLGQIDAVIGACLAKPMGPSAAFVTAALRIGVAQLLFLDTAPHAAVDASVGLVKGQAPKLSGLVNAVLRRIARDGAAMIGGHDAAKMNTPPWMWRAWTRTYGKATAQAIGAAHLADHPPTDFTLKDPARAGEWVGRLDARLLPTGSLRRDGGGRIAELPGYASGDWWVQDAAAALPARLLLNGLAHAGVPTEGADALDLCAGLGGKTAQLAAAGLKVAALDSSGTRLATLRTNLERLGLNAQTIRGDARAYQAPRPVPAILLDAPCTATGTLRRRPDVALLKKQADVASLAALQAELLRAAVGSLAPRGVLVYAVCSLQPEEGVDQVRQLLEEDSAPGVRRLPIAAGEVPGLGGALTADGDLQTLPCHLASEGGIDGFFVSRLVRPG